MRANECCAIINNVISTLTKRINNMWNTIFLLFVINDGIEPEFINITSDYVSIYFIQYSLIPI